MIDYIFFYVVVKYFKQFSKKENIWVSLTKRFYTSLIQKAFMRIFFKILNWFKSKRVRKPIQEIKLKSFFKLKSLRLTFFVDMDFFLFCTQTLNNAFYVNCKHIRVRFVYTQTLKIILFVKIFDFLTRIGLPYTIAFAMKAIIRNQCIQKHI